MTLKPPIEMNADRPVRMSHMANNRKPIFLLNLMQLLLKIGIRNSGLPFFRLVQLWRRDPIAQLPIPGRSFLCLP